VCDSRGGGGEVEPADVRGFTGVWRLNLERSSIPPVTKSQVLVIETDGASLTMREELVNDRDETLSIGFEGGFDGQDYPVTGTPFADTVSYRLVDLRTIEGTAKKDGRVCVKEIAVLSNSGDEVHVTYLSYDERGDEHRSSAVFVRSTR
jgi:hypothetical protein